MAQPDNFGFGEEAALLKESAYGLGATTWEVVWTVVLPYTKAGVIGGIMLGLGRALGETMAVTFVIGNFNQLNSLSLFEAANSITSALANEFAEAGAGLHQASLIYLGLDPDTTDRDELEKAVEVVAKVRPYVRKFHSSSYVNDLADGGLCLAIGFSGDMLIASSRAKEAGKPFTITYRLAKEGNLVWADVLAVPADAAHPEAAHAFIDFFLRPEIAAVAATETGFSTANRAALPLLDEKLRSNADLYPSEEAQKRLHLPKALSQKALKMWSQAWDRAKGLR